MVVLPQMTALVPPYYEECHIAESYQTICEEVGAEYAICPELLEALIERESRGDANAQNGSCKGLCQISEKWHKDRMERLGVDDIFDPEGNIMLAADYLMEMAADGMDIAVALGTFHGESHPELKISSYTTWILDRAEELEHAHGK